MPFRRLLTVKEAAEALSCGQANVYGLIEAGDLPVVLIGVRKGYRIDAQDIDDFIQQRKLQKKAAPVRASRPKLKHIRLP